MKRQFQIVGFLVCFVCLTVYFVSNNRSRDKKDYYLQLVNSTFEIGLNEMNSQLLSSNSILSRDSIYMLHYRITPEKENNLSFSLDTWSDAVESTMLEHIVPLANNLDGIEQMIQASKNDRCRFKVSIKQTHEYVEEVALLMVDLTTSELYFFYFSA